MGGAVVRPIERELNFRHDLKSPFPNAHCHSLFLVHPGTGRRSASSNPFLNKKGLLQASRLGEYLRRCHFLTKQDIGAIYTSTLRRALQAAAVMFHNHLDIPGGKILVHPLLSEEKDINSEITALKNQSELIKFSSLIGVFGEELPLYTASDGGINSSVDTKLQSASKHQVLFDWIQSELRTKNLILFGHSRFWAKFEFLATGTHSNVNHHSQSCGMLQFVFHLETNVFEKVLLDIAADMSQSLTEAELSPRANHLSEIATFRERQDTESTFESQATFILNEGEGESTTVNNNSDKPKDLQVLSPKKLPFPLGDSASSLQSPFDTASSATMDDDDSSASSASYIKRRPSFRFRGFLSLPVSSSSNPIDNSSDFHSVFLIRHAESLNNSMGAWNSWRWVSDPLLSRNGLRQANDLGKLLLEQNFLQKQNIAEIYSSPLRRAMLTAFYVLKNMIGGSSTDTIQSQSPRASSPSSLRIKLQPLMSEVRTSIGDTGHTFTELLEDPSMTDACKFFDFEKQSPKMSQRWWPAGEGVMGRESVGDWSYRLGKFEQWLKHLVKDKNVVMVGHSHFWQEFEKRTTGNRSASILLNCGMLQLTYDRVKDEFVREHWVCWAEDELSNVMSPTESINDSNQDPTVPPMSPVARNYLTGDI